MVAVDVEVADQDENLFNKPLSMQRLISFILDHISLTFTPLLIILLLSFSSTCFAQTDMIEWSVDHELSWDDFQALPMENMPMHAMTASGISFGAGGKQSNHEVTLTFTITAIFSPSESWRNVENSSPSLLAHEQLHFDITELFARKLRKRLLHYPFTENFNDEYQQIYQQILKETDFMQQKYDEETIHSNDLEKQTKWAKLIHDQLNELADYTDKEILVEFQF